MLYAGRDLEDLVPSPLSLSDIFCYNRLHKASSVLPMNTSRELQGAAYLTSFRSEQEFWCLAILTVKKVFQISSLQLPSLNFIPLPTSLQRFSYRFLSTELVRATAAG